MNEKILIFGNGQIGNFYKRFFEEKGVDFKLVSVDITKKEDVEAAISEYNPTVVINTAAKTDLEWCANNRLDAYNVNVLGADNIAQICDAKNIYFIHYSSGCIFQSFSETDVMFEDSEVNPQAYYSWTKVWAENLIPWKKSANFRYLIMRPRQPISAEVHYKNMLMKMLTFTKYVDTPNTGTVIEDMMEWTLKIIEKKPVGVLHVANEGWSTPYEIGLMLKKYVLPSLEPIKITKEELDKMTPNTRVDTIMNVDKLKALGVEVRPYKERLEEIIQKLAENIKSADKQYLKEQLEETVSHTKMRTTPNEVWKELL